MTNSRAIEDRLAPHAARLGALAALLAFTLLSRPCASQEMAHIRTGFVPDPAILEGETRGERAGSELDPSCAGFFPSSPTRRFQLDTRVGFLRIFATSTADLTIAVRTPEGDIWCNDDRYATHPLVEGILPPGVLEIYVGTHAQGVSARYSLFLTETRSVRPGVGRDSSLEATALLGGDIGLSVEASAGAHEDLRVRRGFIPDPRVLRGVAGGDISAELLGGQCHGRVAAQPGHVLTLRDDFDFAQLYVRRGHQPADPEILDGPPAPGTPGSEADLSDISLVVLTPDGRFLCDSRRDVPSVSADQLVAGEYRVWVGYEREGVQVPYRLGVSEIRRVR